MILFVLFLNFFFLLLDGLTVPKKMSAACPYMLIYIYVIVIIVVESLYTKIYTQWIKSKIKSFSNVELDSL